MPYYNRIVIVGEVRETPELRQVGGQSMVCTFPVVTSRKWKNKDGEQQERSDWHRVAVWGKQAQICSQYLYKGATALVEGALQYESYADRDGVQRTSCEIIASNVQFLSPPRSQEREPQQPQQPQQPQRPAYYDRQYDQTGERR